MTLEVPLRRGWVEGALKSEFTGLALVSTDVAAQPGRSPRELRQRLRHLSNIVHGPLQSANLGYWVDEQYAGRGIVPTAVALAADHCWFTLGLHRIEVAIRPENKASLRVVEKLGFRFEGERPRFLHIDGDWRDHRIFALNVEEVGPGLVARLV